MINKLYTNFSKSHYFIHLIWLKFLLFSFFCFVFSLKGIAQQDKNFVREGNKQYENKKYNEAEKKYTEALQKNKKSTSALFNLGDAYYKQNKFAEAESQFQQLTNQISSKDSLSRVYHNLGNSLLKQKKYKESIEAYKNSLKNNPDDNDTRYNLAFAQQMIKQEQQNNKDKKDDKKDKDNKDKKDEKKDKDKKDDKKQNENKNEDKKNQEKKEQKPEDQKNNISKEDAKRLLDALQNDEKNIQEKLKKQNVKGVKVQIEKDW